MGPGTPAASAARDDRADGRQPGPAGDRENRAGMLRAQIGRAERPADPHHVPDLEAVADQPAHATGQHAQVELESGLAGRVGHGVVARLIGGEGELELGELSGREGERPARLDGEAQPQDVMGERGELR